jgi:sialic acid synthase SpsE
MSETIKIGNIFVGRDEPVYVIAEMACAHDGDMGKARRLVDAAVSATADAIQLQFFSRKDLMTPDHEVYDLLGTLEFSHEEWTEIYEYARKQDIHVFACTYDVPSAELAIALGVDGIKLNSSDLSNPDLLEIVAKANIPYTLGTGASTVDEIGAAVETSLSHGGNRIIIMHGVQNFPTEIRHAQINKIKILKDLFSFPVGYQDHTDASLPFSRMIDLLAVGMGASVIEKHITLDRSEKGTDYQAALEPEEFVEFVKMIRMAERAMGPDRLLPLGEKEREYRRFQKKCIVSLYSLKAGDVIDKKGVAFLRTGRRTDLSPLDVDQILGKKLKRDVSPYQPLEWQDIQE